MATPGPEGCAADRGLQYSCRPGVNSEVEFIVGLEITLVHDQVAGRGCSASSQPLQPHR